MALPHTPSPRAAQYKVAAWGALFCLIASVANMKPAEMDFKTIAASATFSIMVGGERWPARPPSTRADTLARRRRGW